MVITNTMLQASIKAYRIDPERNARDLITTFAMIVREIVKYAPFQPINERRLIYVAMENVPKYDKKKGRCFNYFTTIMLNEVKKQYRARKEEQRLREKYDKYFL